MSQMNSTSISAGSILVGAAGLVCDFVTFGTPLWGLVVAFKPWNGGRIDIISEHNKKKDVKLTVLLFML